MSATAQTVVAGVVARLRRILPANGYETDAGLRVYTGLETMDENAPMPALSVYMDREQVTDQPRIGCPEILQSGTFAVAFWIRPVEVAFVPGGDPTADTLNPLFPVLRDLKRALLAPIQPADDALYALNVDLVYTTTGVTPRGDDGWFSDGVFEFSAEWHETLPPIA